ncbi:MAG: hypothetical protein KDI13_02235 [Alphaproteobacteria bacterium]|nr:hypothetical protein [Alphaproteobacteria bacterium]
MARFGVFVFALFLLMLFPLRDVQAARFSGEYLLKVCMLDKNGGELIAGGKIACQAYISGVIDYYNMMKSFEDREKMKGFDFCLPDDVSLNEVHLRVLSYLIEHKKMHRQFVAAPAVMMALSAAYPCRR